MTTTEPMDRLPLPPVTEEELRTLMELPDTIISVDDDGFYSADLGGYHHMFVSIFPDVLAETRDVEGGAVRERMLILFDRFIFDRIVSDALGEWTAVPCGDEWVLVCIPDNDDALIYYTTHRPDRPWDDVLYMELDYADRFPTKLAALLALKS